MIDIIVAIRKMCEPKSGFIDMFDKNKSYDKLLKLAGGKQDAQLFAKLIYGRARKNLIKLIKHACEYQKYTESILSDLVLHDLSLPEAKRALEIFLRAFGFTGYRDIQINPLNQFTCYEKGDFKCIYVGETKDGKEYGFGVRNNYFEGKSCGFDRCTWINGRMLGYCYTLEVEFGTYKTNKYGFVLNDTFVGEYMTEYEDGEKAYMKGENLPL